MKVKKFKRKKFNRNKRHQKKLKIKEVICSQSRPIFRLVLFVSDFFHSNSLIFKPKVEKIIWLFFHSILATNFNYGTKNNGRMK